FGSTGASRKGMLAVLEQAQAAGQKSQQDALIGQGSIFDLDPAPGAGGTNNGFAAPSRPPIPAEEFDQASMLAAEKESIGLFISAHPLKQVGPALRARIDCSLAELAERRDGDWVTVGGMITQTKRIRTKKGDPMMFATLDDLEGAVEMLVFGKPLAACEQALTVDSIVVVRGKVDHKDRDKICLLVQDATRFEPTEGEVAQARERAAKVAPVPRSLRLRLDASRLPARALVDLKDVLEGFPGDLDVVIELHTSTGPRCLKLGPGFRVTRTAGLQAELDALLGSAALHETAAPA
ncbi:MAG TPA: OB-fold nucleic acid binding domain-containing protein, partial [Solirubrobacteraceae bacterium]|nr:OB-fold nucleic acid binding domain-containing protein [Solirubrobacteraceae bacterium]